MRFALLFLVFFSVNSFAQSNPMMRECRMSGGQFFAGSGLHDEFALCFFDQSAIDALSLMKLKNGDSTIAIQIYLTGTDPECFNGLKETLFGSNYEVKVCRFGDDSIITAETLKFGFGSPRNKKLDEIITR